MKMNEFMLMVLIACATPTLEYEKNHLTKLIAEQEKLRKHSLLSEYIALVWGYRSFGKNYTANHYLEELADFVLHDYDLTLEQKVNSIKVRHILRTYKHSILEYTYIRAAEKWELFRQNKKGNLKLVVKRHYDQEILFAEKSILTEGELATQILTKSFAPYNLRSRQVYYTLSEYKLYQLHRLTIGVFLLVNELLDPQYRLNISVADLAGIKAEVMLKLLLRQARKNFEVYFHNSENQVIGITLQDSSESTEKLLKDNKDKASLNSSLDKTRTSNGMKSIEPPGQSPDEEERPRTDSGKSDPHILNTNLARGDGINQIQHQKPLKDNKDIASLNTSLDKTRTSNGIQGIEPPGQSPDEGERPRTDSGKSDPHILNNNLARGEDIDQILHRKPLKDNHIDTLNSNLAKTKISTDKQGIEPLDQGQGQKRKDSGNVDSRILNTELSSAAGITQIKHQNLLKDHLAFLNPNLAKTKISKHVQRVKPLVEGQDQGPDQEELSGRRDSGKADPHILSTNLARLGISNTNKDNTPIKGRIEPLNPDTSLPSNTIDKRIMQNSSDTGPLDANQSPNLRTIGKYDASMLTTNTGRSAEDVPVKPNINLSERGIQFLHRFNSLNKTNLSRGHDVPKDRLFTLNTNLSQSESNIQTFSDILRRHGLGKPVNHHQRRSQITTIAKTEHQIPSYAMSVHNRIAGNRILEPLEITNKPPSSLRRGVSKPVHRSSNLTTLSIDQNDNRPVEQDYTDNRRGISSRTYYDSKGTHLQPPASLNEHRPTLRGIGKTQPYIPAYNDAGTEPLQSLNLPNKLREARVPPHEVSLSSSENSSKYEGGVLKRGIGKNEPYIPPYETPDLDELVQN